MTTFVVVQVTRVRDMLVGAAFQAGDAAELLAASVRYTASRPFNGSSATVQRRLGEMAGRGAAEREKAQLRAAAALDAAVTAIATSALVNKMVDAQLDRVLRPLVRDILDDVLELLEKEPDRVQSLVRGQRDTMVDELVGRIRSGAAAGDTAVDRVTAKVLRREA
ncbi:hypothetical protein [Paractinoplanes globisporus]|jgi:hypothetical protein|uniref:Glutamyl-tRNA reductase n=1 Tax=Paractinoplanes globisporus TaxID=113565 RepID=A0ABW6WUK3_9ACTN|nr:hypothetical protein [Actinoplanes globisporus]